MEITMQSHLSSLTFPYTFSSSQDYLAQHVTQNALNSAPPPPPPPPRYLQLIP